jgi:hypothetical protein
MQNLNDIKFLLTKLKLNMRKTTPGQPNQDIHYSEDKISYKVVALTYP